MNSVENGMRLVCVRDPKFVKRNMTNESLKTWEFIRLET